MQRFVALGALGWEQFKNGELDAAARSFRAQNGIFRPNAEPFVSLALLESSRGNKKEALEHLRSAVVRGFKDLRRIELAEVWHALRNHLEFKKMQDVVPRLIEIERDHPAWSSFSAWQAPEDYAIVVDRHGDALRRIDAMAPALGPRLTRLWKKVMDRASAALLEAYIEKRPDAEDLRDAATHLMRLYSGGSMLRWQTLDADAAERLAGVSTVVLERLADETLRPTALVSLAVALNGRRSDKGVLEVEAAEAIRAALGEVLEGDADPAILTTALVGMVRTEMQAGRRGGAAARFRAFADRHAGDREVEQRVREELGLLALRLGGLPEFQATTLDGRTVGRDALAGKVTVLDFWATWCGPCVEEIPTLRKIDKRHGDEVLLLGVNMDTSDTMDLDDLRQWIESRRMPGSHASDGLGWDSEIVRSFGVKEIPFNVVVGPDGSILAINQHGKRLEKAVTAALR